MAISDHEAAILLKDIRRENSLGNFWKSSKVVRHGELLHDLYPRVKAIPRKDGKLAHNYQLASDPSVTLFCTEDDVAPLNDYEYKLLVAIKSREARYDYEYKLLVAIKSREARYDVFQKKILDWGSQLKVGDDASVILPGVVLNQTSVLSTIKYIGQLSNDQGIQFGIEIMVSMHYQHQ